jgi:putative ABC transport system ATP-binding protein
VAAQSERVIYLIDGGIRGELKLGRMGSADELGTRERKLRAWLTEQGW